MATGENTTGTETGSMVVGKVVILYGNVKAIASDGTERVLAVNSPIFAFDRVVTESDGMVSIVIDDTGTQVDLGRMSDMVIDEDVFAGVAAGEAADAAAEVEQIQELLLAEGEEFDPTAELEAPAAGGAASAGGGHPVPEFDRVTHEGDVTFGAETTGFTPTGVDPITGIVEETTPPEAFPDELSETEGLIEDSATNTGNLTDNDISNDGPLSVISIEVGGETYDIPTGGSVTVETPLGGNLTVDSDGNYDYTPPSYVDHTATDDELVSEEFTYEIINSNGDTDSSTLTVYVADTEPTAYPDSDSVTEDSVLVAEGNVITDAEGDGGQDDLAADPAKVTNINGSSVTAGTTAADGTEIAGDYGTLTIGADGSYVYTLNNDSTAVQGLSDGETLNDSYQYTITDIDGDPSSTTLNIIINGADDLAVVNLSDVNVLEGSETAIITATIDNPPQGSDLVMTLSNGATVTIAEGETSGTSTPFAIQGDDPYVDGEIYTVSVTNASGGIPGDINTSDTSTVTVDDTIDTTTASLSTADVNENAEGVTFKATLSNPGETDVTVVTDQGNIDIAAGDSTGTLFVNTADPDVYVDPDSISATVTDVTGGNFEAVDFSDASTTAQISDTIDDTTVNLSGEDVNEGDVTATITATVDNAPETDLVLTLDNAAADTITIAAGTYSGSTEVAINNDNVEDFWNDPSNFDVNIASDNGGGNYENLVYGTAATVNVADVDDDTTVNLSGEDVNEGDVTATITATVDNAPETDLVLTLDNAAADTITIAAGTYSGSTEVAINNDNVEDFWNDPSNFDVNIASDNGGGNYENLVYGTAATVNVADVDDDTTVNLSGEDVNEGDVTATITATVDNAPETDLVLTLDNAAADTITIAAGTYSGSTEVAINNDNVEDFWNDPSNFDVNIASDNGGGNYENLVYGTAATVNVADVDDDTTVNLSGEDVNEGDVTATITATVDNAPETDLVLTLDNAAADTITIAAGTYSGSTEVAINNDNVEDFWNDPSNFDVNIASDNGGGNYENLVYGTAATVNVADVDDDTTVNLSGEDVNEGDVTATITATVDNAPETDLVLTLDNAAADTITIAAGTYSGSTEVAINNDNVEDFWNDPSNFDVNIASDNGGGNYENLVYGTAATVNVADVDDDTTVNLSGEDVNEGDVTATITATVDNAPETDLVLTLDNAAADTITIAAGTYSGSTEVAINNDNVEDFWNDPSNFDVNIASDNGGGNYENLVYGTAATVNVADVDDDTTVNLSGEDVNEGDVTATITATVDNAPETDLVLTLDNAAADTITIAAGTYSGSTEVAINNDNVEDFWNDPSNFDVNIASDNGGGNYENLVYGTAATVNVADVDDDTTVNLSGEDVNEGDVTATITATVDNAPETDLVLTLDNAAADTITIAAGTYSGSTEVAINNDNVEDFWNDPSNFDVNIASDNGGGNYENLVYGTAATVNVADVDDDTTVNLSGEDVNEGDVTATITATVDNAPETDLVLTLDNAAADTITIAAGTYSGSTEVAINNDNVEDFWNDPSNFDVNIASDNGGGNYENLVYGTAATVNVADVDDPTYVSIIGPAEVAEGATTTEYTVALTNAPEGDATVNFTYTGTATDGSDYTKVGSVDILDGETEATFTIDTEDDFEDEGPETIIITIDDVTGGNYEQVLVDEQAGSVTTTIIDNIPPVVEGATVTVSEEGLAGAIPDTDGSDTDISPADTTNNASVLNGTLTLSDANGDSLTVTLTDPPADGALKSNGTDINWTGQGTNTLIGATNTATIITISIDDSGNYDVIFTGQVDHGEVDVEDVESFGVTVDVNDGTVSSTATLTVNIEDDSPTIDAMNLAIPNIENTYEGSYSFVVGADSQAFNEFIAADSLIWNEAPEGWSLQYDAANSSSTSQVYFTTYNNEPTEFFTISINDDGTYDFTLDEPKPVTVSDPINILQGIEGGSGLASYTFDSSIFGGYFSLVITGETNAGADTLTISSTDLGVSDNVVQENKGDTLIFNLDPEAGFENSVTITKLAVTISNSASIQDDVNVHLHVVYTDGSEVDSYQPYHKAADGIVEFELDDTKTLDYFTLANDETDGKNYSFKIDGISLEYQTTTYPDDYQLDFTLNGTDADNDSANTDFSVLVNTADVDGHYEIHGSDGNDIIYGTDGDDTIYGHEGDDVIIGGGGVDDLFGGAGADVYHANDGIEDTIGDGASDDLSLSDLDTGLDNLIADPEDTV